MKENGSKSPEDILGAFENIKDKEVTFSDPSEQTNRRQEALDKVTQMLEAAKSANTRTKKKKPKKSDEPAWTKEDITPFMPTEKKLYSQEAVDKVTEMLDSARAANKHHIKKDQPELPAEPIIKSETAADKVESEPKDSRQVAVDKVAEMISSASAANELEKKKPKLSDSSGEIVLLEFISFIIFIVTYNSNVPEIIPLVAVFLPVIAGIGGRILLQQLTLREAAAKCKMHIIITCFFFVCITLSLV